jgi:hypothetical protein
MAIVLAVQKGIDLPANGGRQLLRPEKVKMHDDP